MGQEKSPRWWESQPDIASRSPEEMAMLGEIYDELKENIREFYEFYLTHREEWRRLSKAKKQTHKLYSRFKKKWQRVPLTGVERDLMLWVEVFELAPADIEAIFGVSCDNFYHIKVRAEGRMTKALTKKT